MNTHSFDIFSPNAIDDARLVFVFFEYATDLLYSVYSPLNVRQPEGRKIYRQVEGYGVKSYHGDGNNALEVHRLAGEAIRYAREGNGPAFLEFYTYRWREHCGPYYDNDLGYRTEAEFQEWRKLCPVDRLKTQLLKDNIFRQSDIDRLTSEYQAEIEEAIAFAKASPFPDESTLMEHVYCP